MRHHVDGRKLGRTSAHRKAMFANMAASLVIHDRIETTLPKAKELKPMADRLVTWGKDGTLHARRKVLTMIRDKRAVRKLFDELSKRFAGRNGGYTRILKLGWRHGDAAPMAAIEYLQSEHKSHSGEEGKAAKAKKAEAREKAKSVLKKAAKPVVEKKAALKTRSVSTKQVAKRSQAGHKATRGD